MKYLKSRKYSILSKVSKYSFIFIIALSLMVPFMFAKAVDCKVGDPGCPTISTTIKNPLGDKLTTIPDFIYALIKIVMYVGVPIVALAIIYTGFLFITAQGDEKKLTEAKKAIVNTLIGAVILLGAFVIANAIKQTVDDIKS